MPSERSLVWRVRQVFATWGMNAAVVQKPAIKPRTEIQNIGTLPLDALRARCPHYLLTTQYLGFYTFLTTFYCGRNIRSYHLDSSVIRRSGEWANGEWVPSGTR